MDEAEKYKQRLEAIAEKRRVLEEQERVKREMEDERIRLQQLKRKSLRDQWLMEGPPLSPTSLDAPRSPLWGTQAQEIEKRINKLASETQRLTEDDEKVKEEMDESQTKMVIVTAAEFDKEIAQDVVHNGKHAAESGEEMQSDNPPLDNVILMNGAGDNQEHTSHNASSVDVQLTRNGLTEEIEDVEAVNMVINNDDDEEEEEEGTMVIRAECIMITDEGDDAAEEETKDNSCVDENAPLFPEDTQKTVTESVEIEKMAAATDKPGLFENAVIADGTEEEKVEIIPQIQLQSTVLSEGAVGGSVPVYSETQPSVITSNATVENEDANHTVEVSKPKESVTVEFQEVPLTEVKPGEQEPLLAAAKAQETHKEPATTSIEEENPNRADQAEIKAPKQKTCQCCSVM